MQSATPKTCDASTRLERHADERYESTATDQKIPHARQRITSVLDWLDTHWDDPELRSGFWRSGW